MNVYTSQRQETPITGFNHVINGYKKGRAFQFTAKVLLLQRIATLPSSPAETVSVSTANEAGIASQSCLTESHQYTGLLQS